MVFHFSNIKITGLHQPNLGAVGSFVLIHPEVHNVGNTTHLSEIGVMWELCGFPNQSDPLLHTADALPTCLVL
jgi:hypothetical protein